MNLEDLKDQWTSGVRATWGRIQDSSTYHKLVDRYENLTPAMQKVSIAGTATVAALAILSIPYSYYTQSVENVGDFEGKRSTIRELLKVSRESADVPQIPPAPSLDAIRTTIESQLKDASLLPEQMKGIDTNSSKSSLIPPNLSEGGLQINLAKLNLQQVLDLGYQMQSISPSVKLKDLIMKAHREDERYFDVTYHLVALAVPEVPEANAEPVIENVRGRKQKNSDSEEEN